MSTDTSYAPKKPNDEMMAWLDEGNKPLPADEPPAAE